MDASRAARQNYVPAPAEPQYPLANGQPAAASVPDLQNLYGQLLTAISSQPKPADLSRYSSEAAYANALASMQQGYGNLSQIQAQLQQMLNPDQWAAQEQALLDLQQPRPSRTVLLYGMQ
jgi:hypothetical protein